MAQRLTDKAVKALPAPARGNQITYDTEIKGFGARITAAGAIAFVLNYRRRTDALERRFTIGSFPDWSVAAAREKAKELKRHVDGGGDPVGEHVADRAAPTVADLCARFLEEHVVKQRPHTRADYESIIRNDILPTLGKIKIAAIEFEHIERLHARITKRAPVRANRVHAVLTTMFGLAVRWKMRADNPAKGVKRNQEHGRERYLKPDELARLTKALAEDPNQRVADVFRLLLLTGARRGEVLAAEWDQIDLEAGEWVKPHGMVKQARQHRLPLNAPARQLLARLQASSAGSPFVFPRRRDGLSPGRDDLKHSWSRICKAAGITGLRIHDLRHSHASHLVSAGFSLPIIGQLLGHRSPTTTARYSHLLDDPLRKASEAVGALLSGQPAADVVPIRKGRRR